MGVILWLQQFASPGLDAFFLAVTRLGNEGFYLVFLPLVYWNLDRPFGFRLTILFLVSMFTNFVLKDTLQLPRPSGPGIRVPEGAAATGYGFPSGHAQGNTTIWAAIALRYRSPWLTVMACVIVGLVSLSRVYLGVHYPADVLGGIAIGLLVTVLFFRIADACGKWPIPVPAKAVLSFALPFLGVLIYRANDAYRIAGVASGFAVGYVLYQRFLGGSRREGAGLPSRPGFAFRLAVIRSAIGLGVAIGVRLLTSPYFPEGLPQMVRFWVIGLWVSFLAPWVFLRLGLERGREGSPS